MTERQMIDKSDASTVALCSCGWRELVATPDAAWRVAAAHGVLAHPHDNSDHARRMANRYGQR